MVYEMCTVTLPLILGGFMVHMCLCCCVFWLAGLWYLTLYICIIDKRKRNESCEATPHGTVFYLVQGFTNMAISGRCSTWSGIYILVSTCIPAQFVEDFLTNYNVPMTIDFKDSSWKLLLEEIVYRLVGSFHLCCNVYAFKFSYVCMCMDLSFKFCYSNILFSP